MSEIEEVKNACAVVGELVLMASALDHQLNRVCILALSLNESQMLEPLVASLDSARKIEILKVRAAKINAESWKNAIIKHVKGVEKVNKIRNKAAHNMLAFENGKAVLFSAAFAKLISNIDMQTKKLKKIKISELQDAIKHAEILLGEGIILIENLKNFQVEVKKAQKVT